MVNQNVQTEEDVLMNDYDASHKASFFNPRTSSLFQMPTNPTQTIDSRGMRSISQA